MNQMDKTKLPPILLYRDYLNMASTRFNLTMDQCRDKYGLYTIEEWEDLFSRTKTILDNGSELTVSTMEGLILLDHKAVYVCEDKDCGFLHCHEGVTLDDIEKLLKPHKSVIATLDKVSTGKDCKKSESAEIKGWLRDTLLSPSDLTAIIERWIQNLLPQEYVEYLEGK